MAQAAANSAPEPATALGQLRVRVREMEARVVLLESTGATVSASGPAASKKTAAPAAAAAPKPAAAGGITPVDLAEFVSYQPPKGKPTPEQKVSNLVRCGWVFRSV